MSRSPGGTTHKVLIYVEKDGDDACDEECEGGGVDIPGYLTPEGEQRS